MEGKEPSGAEGGHQEGGVVRGLEVCGTTMVMTDQGRAGGARKPGRAWEMLDHSAAE